MYDDWPEMTKVLSANCVICAAARRTSLRRFPGLRRRRWRRKALDTKTKELIALGISYRHPLRRSASPSTSRRHLQQGATSEEASETLGMAIYMGAGPSAMYASHAFAALQQFDAVKTIEPA